MGATKELLYQKQAKPRHAKSGKNGHVSSNFVSFHPTKEEKESIRDDERTMTQVLDALTEYVRLGHKLMMGYKPENEAVYVLLREGGVEWTDAVSLSAWHIDTEMAFRCLLCALEGRFANFPSVQLSLFDRDVSW